MSQYYKKPHPIFVKYVNNIATEYNFKDIKHRLIFAAKCLGYLDSLFNKSHKFSGSFKAKEYMSLKRKIVSIVPKEIGLR